MRNLLCLLLTSVLFTLNPGLRSQSICEPYEVATWHGFRQGAVSYTFDDATLNQYTKAIPMFNELDFPLTMFVVTSWAPRWDELQSAALMGHEIASHSVSHLPFWSISEEQQEVELSDSKGIINSSIAGEQCVTFAYPYCVTGNDSLCSTYYIAARGCSGAIEPSTPSNFMNISSIIVGSEGSIRTLPSFINHFNRAADKNGWCVLLLHGVDSVDGYSPIPSDVLRGSLEYLNERRSILWVATFKDVAIYIKQRDAISVHQTIDTDSLKSIEVTHNLDDLNIFNQPVTIRRPLPPHWPSADVMQGNTTVPSCVVLVDGTVYLAFDAIPNAGTVTLTKNDTLIEPEVDTLPDNPVPDSAPDV